MRGLAIEDIGATILFLVIAVVFGFIGVIFFAINQSSISETSFVLIGSVEGTGIPGGLLQHKIEGESVAGIASRALLRDSLVGAGSDGRTLGLFMSRLDRIFKGKLKIDWGSGYTTGAPPIYCGKTADVIAYCEYGEQGCSSGRSECIAGACNDNLCGNSGICCSELYSIDRKEFLDGLNVEYCEGKKGVCEVIGCAPGRVPLVTADSCSGVLSKETDLQVVPIDGLESPFPCCRPLGKKELERIVVNKEVPTLKVPLFLSGDQKIPGGYTRDIVISSEK